MDGFEIFFTMLAALGLIGCLITRSERYQKWLDGDNREAQLSKSE